MSERKHSVLGEMLYKWAYNPTEPSGFALYKTLIRQLDAEYDKYLDITVKENDPSKIMSEQNFFYNRFHNKLSDEICEKSKDRFLFFAYFSPDGKHPHSVGFHDYKNHKMLYMYSTVDHNLIEDIQTRQITFDELFAYVTSDYGGESHTRSVMLAFYEDERDAIAKAIGCINQAAVRCNATIEPRSWQEHQTLKDKIYKKALMTFVNDNIRLPVYEINDKDLKTLHDYVFLRLAETGRLLMEKMKVDDLVSSDDEQPAK